MYNKKGLSAIVATVLIVLLVIAGVTLVWTPIRKLITEQAGELEASCLMANPQIVKACMNGLNLELTISNGAELEIDGIQVIYGDDADTLTSTDTSSTSIGVNQVSSVIVTNADGTPDAVKIAAIVGSDPCASGSITEGITAC